MSATFSPELIARAQEIFERRSGRAVDVEETERCLEAVAKLGLLAARVNEQFEKARREDLVHECDRN